MNYDKYICNIFITNKNKINSNKIRKLKQYPNIYNYLLNRYKDENCIKIIIWRIYKKIENRNICKICGNYTKFDNSTKTYKTYCCSSCAAKSIERNEKYKKTSLKKYGHINPLHNKEINKKIINKWIKKYNCDNPLKSEIIKEKSKQTCLKKYGVKYSFQSENNINKSKQTKLKKYGDEHFINLEKRKQTCLEKYGYEHSVQSEIIKEKSKQTCLKNYGVDNYFKTQESIIKSHSKEAINKINQTKKKNNTYNKSKPEDESYLLLKKKYPDIKRQYKDTRYPFACDFYIPESDTFIECNYSWTHGFHPYNENNEEDQNKLRKWKYNNTKYYNNAITTWTIRDVNKRNIAKQNNLNYIEFWNINELKNWLNKYETK